MNATKKWFDYPEQNALIGIHHVGYIGAIEEGDIDGRSVQMLARSLNIRNLVAFIGSGLSRSYGHLNWDQFTKKLVDRTIETIGKREGLISEEESHLLKKFSDDVESNADNSSRTLSRSDRNVLILDICEEIYHRLSATDPSVDALSFHKAAAKIIEGHESKARPTKDPLLVLIETLKIRRFLTTNYDNEIEKAFERAGLQSKAFPPKLKDERLSKPALAARPTAWSLSLGPHQLDGVARFAATAPGFEYGVLHLHGAASDPSSMLLTERDYQRLYLLDDPVHRAYRQTLEIAFGGNAILFLGVGMGEGDLLRPLRQFISERSGGGHERPLFALLRRPDDNVEAVEFKRYLYARYGVKVLYYDSGKSAYEMTEALIGKLLVIERKRQNWWSDWQNIPEPRNPEFYKYPDDPAFMARHYVELPDRQEWLCDADPQVIRAHLKPLNSGKKAMAIMGSPGAGKGTVGQLLALFSKDLYQKRFFATMHFSNDIQSIVEGAANFFRDGKLAGAVDAFEDLENQLKNECHLLVLGGIERLLKRIGIDANDERDVALVGEGQATSTDAMRLFDLVQKIANEGTSNVVLTTSLWPSALSREIVTPSDLPEISEIDVQRHPAFNDAGDIAKRLADALNCHTYALVVIAAWLTGKSTQDKQELLRGLLSRLSAIDSEGRAATAVATVWEERLRSFHESKDRERLTAILQHVALFTTPVESGTVFASCGPGSGDSPEAESNPLQNHIDFLIQAKFLIPIRRIDHTDCRVTAHTLVRNLVLRQLGCEPDTPGEAHWLEPSGWSADVPEIVPGTDEGHKVVTTSIDRLLDRAEKFTGNDSAQIRDLVRGTFGLLRSRWSATTVPRLGIFEAEETWGLPWPHYDAYQRRLARLLNILRKYDRGMLYKDELTWLYNELALVAFSQGLLADAYALYIASSRVSSKVEVKPGIRVTEAEIGLALVLLERGHLSRARRHLEKASRNVSTNKPIIARIKGHLGLVSHLSGDYAAAKLLYDSAIGTLHDIGNLRGESIFLRHRGDLHRKMSRYKESREDIDLSIAAAEAGRCADLVQHARVSDAVVRLAEGKQIGVEELAPVRDFASRVGMRKLDWDARIVQAEIARQDGDVELAGRLAVQCMRLASAYGLRLRLTNSLIMLGRVSRARGNSEAGRQLILSAQALATRQGNQLLFETSERLLVEGWKISRPI